MSRMGTTNGSDTSPVRGTLDQLTYAYSPTSGNQLLAVDDSPQGNANSAKHDFKDNGRNYATSGTVEYRYDDSGNLISDLNKNISGINYSRMNQPVVVDITDKQGIVNHIKYTYTSTGTKLRKELFLGGSTTAASTTDYVGPFVYEGGAAPVFVQTAEGRALYVSGPTYVWKYEYHLKDHLGNLRFAFRADKDNGGVETQAHAGMEPVNAAEEEKQFQHVAETRLADPDRARTGSFVARLNARQGRRQGPTITLQVAAGDSVRADVYGRYDHGGALGGLLPKGAVVTGAAVAVGAGQAGSDRTAPKAGQRRFWPLLGARSGFVPQLFKARVAELPAAYLRYELFNKDSQLVATRLQPLVRTATDEWQRLTVGTKADSAGYVRLSLANESGVAAYFDDMAARGVAPSPYQENHYDPFGLNLVGIEAAQNPNNSRLQYNGKEKQEDAGSNWIDYGARMYDAQLGRWHTIDMLADLSRNTSPYSYVGNNPTNYVDVAGAFRISADMKIKYPYLTMLLKEAAPQIANNPLAIANLMETTGLSKEQIIKNATWRDGPEITEREVGNGFSDPNAEDALDGTILGEFIGGLGDESLRISEALLLRLEKYAKRDKISVNGKSYKQMLSFVTMSTIFHEFIHKGRFQNGRDKYTYPKRTSIGEAGKEWEFKTFNFVSDATRDSDGTMNVEKDILANQMSLFLSNTLAGFIIGNSFSPSTPVEPKKEVHNPKLR